LVAVNQDATRRIRSNVKAVYPPCPDAQASRRFVRVT
jgi:hypothetical protein